MSEEQNLFEAVAPAPPRVKHQRQKPAAKADGGGSSESSESRSFDDGGSAGRETGDGDTKDMSSDAGSGDAGGGGADGQAGTSKSRRRRRKRKNRAAQAANAGADGGVVSGMAAAGAEMPVSLPGEQRQVLQNGGGQHHQGAGSASGAASQNGQAPVIGQVIGQGFQSGQGPQNGQGFQNGQGQGAGGSRRNKKKKFRRAGEGGGEGGSTGQGFQQRPPRPEPGNSLQGSTSGMGQRRNRKQQQGGGGGSRGPRQFVGPMDHSYREANGNFADVPASTVQMGNGRYRNNNGHRHMGEDRMPPELMHNKRPVVIPEDAPTHIYFFIEDLFFTAKIQEAAKQQGVKVAFMKPDKDIVAHLAELHDHEHPSLIVFDLNNAAAKPLTLIPKLKAKLKKGTSIIGFLSHLQGDLKQKAVEAGCHTVMPRSAFSQNLPNLLRRYGVEDEHEQNFNQ